jgi:hypothetical protein
MGDVSGLAALTGFGGVVVGSLISWGVQARLLGRRIAADEGLAKDKFAFDKELAEKKFTYDRELADHKRRVELAEEVLADFYRSADIFREIRSPGGFKGESTARVRAENETPNEASQLDAYFIPIARIAQHSDFFAGLRSKRYRSRALLGQPIDEAFETLDEALWEVRSKAMMLTDMVKRGGAAFELHPDRVEQYVSTIFQRSPRDDDPVEPIVKRGIEVAERVCRPILERAP